MLIENRIRGLIPGMNESQLEHAVKYALEAMREARNELHDHVSLFEVTPMTGSHVRFCIKALRSQQFREFMYNYESFTLFPFCSFIALPDRSREAYRQPLRSHDLMAWEF